MRPIPFVIAINLAAWSFACAWAQSPKSAPNKPSNGDRMIADYFRQETDRLTERCLSGVTTIEEWKSRRGALLRELQEMLGLDPYPERTDLQPKITATTEHDDFVVERLHFQSRPQLYVTANLYRPKHVDGRLPAVLYLCGHGQVKKNDISYGNKAHYQHHGAWFARNGYVCLVLDSLQLGEIEGIHHGTHRYSMFWWLDRGYTPAGVEAWNCVRALDYLESRSDVDPDRMGATGRSGGGAYSWWIAALDERIQASVPTAGITDLQNHVVDGCVEGHCDCMYFVNTYEWDYPLLAAMVAPRPLLIANTDSDSIFPLNGVMRTFEKVRHIYSLYGAKDKVALNITAGPHKDTQELQVHAFRWLNHFLKQDDSLIEKTAVPFFEPHELKVFPELPTDQQNTSIHETFVPIALEPTIPANSADWQLIRDRWYAALTEKAFRAWPIDEPPSVATNVFEGESQDVRLKVLEYPSQHGVRLPMYVVSSANSQLPSRVTVEILDQQQWREFLATVANDFPEAFPNEQPPDGDAGPVAALRKRLADTAIVFVAPRGIGPTAWDPSEKKQVQIQRRFYLLGQTWEGMQVWDVRRALQTIRSMDPFKDVPLTLRGERRMAGVALYASLFEPNVERLELDSIPSSHRDGPHFLNVMRYLDLPQAVTLAAERGKVELSNVSPAEWKFSQTTATALGWGERLKIAAD